MDTKQAKINLKEHKRVINESAMQKAWTPVMDGDAWTCHNGDQ